MKLDFSLPSEAPVGSALDEGLLRVTMTIRIIDDRPVPVASPSPPIALRPGNWFGRLLFWLMGVTPYA